MCRRFVIAMSPAVLLRCLSRPCTLGRDLLGRPAFGASDCSPSSRGHTSTAGQNCPPRRCTPCLPTQIRSAWHCSAFTRISPVVRSALARPGIFVAPRPIHRDAGRGALACTAFVRSLSLDTDGRALGEALARFGPAAGGAASRPRTATGARLARDPDGGGRPHRRASRAGGRPHSCSSPPSAVNGGEGVVRYARPKIVDAAARERPRPARCAGASPGARGRPAHRTKLSAHATVDFFVGKRSDDKKLSADVAGKGYRSSQKS
jgi:hypothetical protein